MSAAYDSMAVPNIYPAAHKSIQSRLEAFVKQGTIVLGFASNRARLYVLHRGSKQINREF